MPKTVHLYDETTGEYAGPYDMQESPLEPGEYIRPTCAFDDAPPAIGEKQTAVVRNNAWVVVPDFRGVPVWDVKTALPVDHADLGALPKTLTDQKPTGYAVKWNGKTWEDARTYAQKRAEEYPPMADYLDAVVKDDTEAMAVYVKACRAIKAKYPKE